jgi:hypothetical protein
MGFPAFLTTENTEEAIEKVDNLKPETAIRNA